MSSECILIVEDNLSYAFMLESRLRDMGYGTVPAHSAKEAIALLEENDCRLVISDLVMPEMDGQELLQALRKEGHDIPFVILVKKVLEDTLKQCEGNKSLAAQRLKINRKMFNRKKPPFEGE